MLLVVFLTVGACLLTGCSHDDEPAVTEHRPVFSYTVTRDYETGWHIVRLSTENNRAPGKNLSVRIVPEGGSTLFSFTAGEHELVYAPAAINTLLDRMTGIPVMYPTPNRVRNQTYRFNNVTYRMTFPGDDKPTRLHGIARDDTTWRFGEPEIKPGAVVMKTWYRLDETNPRFPAFPFRNSLTLEYTLMENCLKIIYTVENLDDKPLGFGIGFHPFWKVIGTPDDVRIQVDIPSHMVAVDKLPTGHLEPVQGTQFDLREPVPLSRLKLDDVYFGASPESTVRFMYDAAGLEIRQTATSDFTHVVVYTPGGDFFCIENQTCSTDAHNLYDRGFRPESGLQIVEPGSRASGSVTYTVIWNERELTRAAR